MKKYDNNFRWFSEYTYDTDHSACKFGDYHRNCRLTNLKVTDIYFDSIYKSLSKFYKINTVKDLYYLDRLMTIYKMYSPDQYSVIAYRGYYGEEVGAVSFDLWGQFQANLEKIFPNFVSKMNFLLIKEYGYLLPELENKYYEIKTLDKSSIIQNRDYQKKLDGYYKYNPELPLGLFLPSGNNKYRLIDGFHRFNQNTDDEFLGVVAF